jgi:hypothetical protein
MLVVVVGEVVIERDESRQLTVIDIVFSDLRNKLIVGSDDPPLELEVVSVLGIVEGVPRRPNIVKEEVVCLVS